jgi:two-component system, NtrC family, response regulator AtoC
MGKQLPSTGDAHGEDTPGQLAWSFVEGMSASMRPVEAVIRELSQTDVPVLLLAETGAGKHATARRIHEMSRRSAQPFHWFQCATLKPEDLSGTEFNGEAPPGAGTIFLEELAELSASSQVHFRDALLQTTGRGLPGGYSARFICGSARDLEVEVKTGRLREDLYYRISGVCLRLPPLRQRKEDIPLLMAHFLRRHALEFHRPVPQVSTEMARLFEEYSWPGNLRDLDDAARVLVALGDEQLAMGGLRALLRKPSAGGNGGGVSLKAASRAASQEAEKELILKVLTRTRWNRRRAAKELQISYKALLYKLKQIRYEGYGAS